MKGLFVHQVCKGEQLVAELELQRLCRTTANLWQAVFCAIRQESINWSRAELIGEFAHGESSAGWHEDLRQKRIGRPIVSP